MDADVITKVLSIVAIDLVLSGDNAVVIAMASRNLPPEQRRKAIIYGGGGAVGLRILFTIAAALLLDVPLLQAVGGVFLLYIAWKLVRPQEGHGENIQSANSLGGAIRTIIMADVVMSLDNVLAVGGAAHGHLGLLIFGLLLSIPILLFGSGLIANLLVKYPWLNYLGAGILVHTSVAMFLHDKKVQEWLFHANTLEEWVISLSIAAFVVFLGVQANRRASRHAQPEVIQQAEVVAEDESSTSRGHA